MILFILIAAYMAFNFSKLLHDPDTDTQLKKGLDLFFGFFIWAYGTVKKFVAKKPAPKAAKKPAVKAVKKPAAKAVKTVAKAVKTPAAKKPAKKLSKLVATTPVVSPVA